MTKAVLMLSLLAVFGGIAEGQTKQKAGEKLAANPSPNVLTKEFRETGTLAYEAVGRLSTSAEKAESIYQPRKLDAEKALAEAKRKVKSLEDRRAYGVVRSWFDQIDEIRELAPGQMMHEKGDERSPLVICGVEAHAYFSDEEMTAMGKELAAKRTCPVHNY
jgi:hypothetical protein